MHDRNAHHNIRDPNNSSSRSNPCENGPFSIQRAQDTGFIIKYKTFFVIYICIWFYYIWKVKVYHVYMNYIILLNII